MVVILPKGSFSNYLDKSSYKRVDGETLNKRHNEYFQNAMATIKEYSEVSELLKLYKATIDSVTFIIKDDAGDFYYLRYVEGSKINIVFDEYAMEILEILIDPKIAVEKETKGAMDCSKNMAVINRVSRFVSEIKPRASIDKMIKECENNDLYFIDTYESERRFVGASINLFFNAMQEIDPKVKCTFYKKSGKIFTVLSKIGDDGYIKIDEEEKEGELKNSENYIYKEIRGSTMIFILYIYGVPKYAISMSDIDMENEINVASVSIMASTLLNFLA